MDYSSRSGESALDLFGGSGPMWFAAEQTGRHAYLMELDALYCDVNVAMYEQFTGRKARRVAAAKERPDQPEPPARKRKTKVAT